jgi:hypothetical protein
MCPAIEEMTTPAPPGATSSPKISNTMATPTRSTVRIAFGDAWTGDSPAVWTTLTTWPTAAAATAIAVIDAREETSTWWVTALWPPASRVSAARARLSALRSARNTVRPVPCRRAMAGPIPPAPMTTTTSSPMFDASRYRNGPSQPWLLVMRETELLGGTARASLAAGASRILETWIPAARSATFSSRDAPG